MKKEDQKKGDYLTQQIIEGAKKAFGNQPEPRQPTAAEIREQTKLDRWATQNKKVWSYLDDPDPIDVDWLKSKEREIQRQKHREETEHRIAQAKKKSK